MPMRKPAKAATERHGIGEVLSPRALNRALLARQLLLKRSSLSVPEVLEHLVGLQSQAPIPPYFDLWSRLSRFKPEDLSALICGRSAVRIVLMRGTIHLVTARDCRALRPRSSRCSTGPSRATHGKRLGGADLGAIEAAGRALVEEAPRTSSELGELLRERFPRSDPSALANAVRARVPLVQVPPRGLWGEGGQATVTSAEAWLGQPLGPGISLDELFLRYLAAFGPATVKDAQVSGPASRVSPRRPSACGHASPPFGTRGAASSSICPMRPGQSRMHPLR